LYTRNVLKRSLDEISLDSIDVTLELIGQGSLYRGAEWKSALESFKALKSKYDTFQGEQRKHVFAWAESVKCGSAIGRIRNHSIGVLLTDISSGVDLDVAVRTFEKIMAPVNYKRPRAIFTKRMVDEAQKKIAELELTDSLVRRHAKLDDITVNNILFVDRGVSSKLSGSDDVFAKMKASITEKSRAFNHIEEVAIDKFINHVLPSASKIEVLFENAHAPNLVSLIAPANKDAKSMFKWSNNFSWAYNGNITDSMKQRVKEAGGKIDGDLRFSIQWNDGKEWNNNDFDAHCITPRNEHIFYANKVTTSGALDVDIRIPSGGIPAVENIVFASKTRMLVGKYQFYIYNYCHRGGRDGFEAEIEFNGKIHSFSYDKELRQGERVNIANVTLACDGSFSIEELLPSNISSIDIWGCKTNTFIPVSVIMNSPNYWDEQEGIGNKHYFFMMDGCQTLDSPNGFFNEYLNNAFTPHRKVFEALGSQMKVSPSTEQLSGLGFSSTQRNSLTCKVTGSTTRVMKVIF